MFSLSVPPLSSCLQSSLLTAVFFCGGSLVFQRYPAKPQHKICLQRSQKNTFPFTLLFYLFFARHWRSKLVVSNLCGSPKNVYVHYEVLLAEMTQGNMNCPHRSILLPRLLAFVCILGFEWECEWAGLVFRAAQSRRKPSLKSLGCLACSKHQSSRRTIEAKGNVGTILNGYKWAKNKI